jgi:hypothetical protein
LWPEFPPSDPRVENHTSVHIEQRRPLSGVARTEDRQP